jgi:hypothetical protein
MQEFDRVQALRGRPRGSDAFASDPNAPQLTAPHPTQVVPATQPVPASQATPSRGRGRGRPRGSRGTTRGAGLAASIRREPSQFEREDLTEVESRRPRTINGLGSVRVASRGARGGRGSRGGRAVSSSTPGSSITSTRGGRITRQSSGASRRPSGMLTQGLAQLVTGAEAAAATGESTE